MVIVMMTNLVIAVAKSYGDGNSICDSEGIVVTIALMVIWDYTCDESIRDSCGNYSGI